MLSVIVRRYWHYSRVVTPTNFCALYYTIHPYAVAVLITKAEILELRPHKIHEIKNIAEVYLIPIWIVILFHEKCLRKIWVDIEWTFSLIFVYLQCIWTIYYYHFFFSRLVTKKFSSCIQNKFHCPDDKAAKFVCKTYYLKCLVQVLGFLSAPEIKG